LNWVGNGKYNDFSEYERRWGPHYCCGAAEGGLRGTVKWDVMVFAKCMRDGASVVASDSLKHGCGGRLERCEDRMMAA